MAKGSVAERTNGTGMARTIRGIATFRALRSANFRLLWAGMLGNALVMGMEQVARSWLVWRLTGSGVALGLVNLFRAGPLLFFGLLSGVAADRMDKRRLLLVTQAITLSLHLSMAFLILSGFVQLWQVFLIAALTGTSTAFAQPTRQSLIPQLVEPGQLMNGIALNNMARNTSRIIGPSVAGVIIASLSVGHTYLSQALVYLVVVVTTAMLVLPSRPERKERASALGDLREGFAYVARTPAVLGQMILALAPMLFAMPYNTILPVFADNVLGMGASGLGLLLSANGVGALVGSVIIASLGNLNRRGLVLLAGVFLFGAFLVAVAFSTSLYLSLPLMAGVGISMTVYQAINNTLLLETTPPALHGRIMAIYMLDRGLMPAGAMLAGTLTDALGAPFALSFMGAVCVLLAVGMGIAMPQVRQID